MNLFGRSEKYEAGKIHNRTKGNESVWSLGKI